MTHHIIHHAGQVRMMPGICSPLRSTGDWDKIAETSTSVKQDVLHLLHCGTYQVFCHQSILHMHPTAVTICEQSTQSPHGLITQALHTLLPRSHGPWGNIFTNACNKLL